MFHLTPKETSIILQGPKRAADALRILQYISDHDGATCDECSKALGYTQHTCSPRVSELEKSGCLIDSGKRHKTRSGSRARVMLVARNADFRRYLQYVRKQQRHKSPRTAALLRAAEDFLVAWRGARSSKVLRTLVVKMLEADAPVGGVLH